MNKKDLRIGMTVYRNMKEAKMSRKYTVVDISDRFVWVKGLVQGMLLYLPLYKFEIEELGLEPEYKEV